MQKIQELTDVPYHLKCRVKSFEKPVHDESGMTYTTLMVLLVPEHNDEFGRFANAWVPEVPTEKPEAAAMIKGHFNPFLRVAVCSGPDSNNASPYIFVMTTGMAKWLHKNKQNQLVDIKILPAGQEDESDQGLSESDGNYDLINDKKGFS